MKVLRLGLLSLCAGGMLAMQSCTGNATKDATTVDGAIAKFHDQFNKNAYAEIYAASESRFKQGCSESDFVELLSKVHKISGDYVSGTQTDRQEEKVGNDTFVTSRQDSKFQNRPIVEIFKFAITDGKPLLYNWKTAGGASVHPSAP